MRKAKSEVETPIKKKRKPRVTLAEKGRELLKKENDENPTRIPIDIPFEPKSKVEQVPSSKPMAKEVIKEIRILGMSGIEKTVSDLIQEEIGEATWEWKELLLDGAFKVSILNELGKEGWKFAFFFERTKFVETAKYDIIAMHRLRKKK
ncbi:MAG TPA: hypothetical protein PKN48_00305 [Bacteroidales bacterium]|nr:hypothetical protein [Bacteroidales bacterium]